MLSILTGKKIIHIDYNDFYEIFISWSTILIHKCFEYDCVFLPSPMCTHLLVGVGGETRMKAACYETS